MNNIEEIIDSLVNITAMSNKWLMWCEMELPAQSVFVPSIFQMRDAFSHLVKMFSYGVDEKCFQSVDACGSLLLENAESQHQLKEAFTHVSRSFFDCADYIVLEIENEMNACNDTLRFITYKKDLRKHRHNITDLRNAKSENMTDTYNNIKKWDSILQIITTKYLLSKQSSLVERDRTALKALFKNIELNSETLIIKDHYPEFFEDKTKLFNDNEFYSPEWMAFLTSDTIDTKNILGWQQQEDARLVKLVLDMDNMKSKLLAIREAMKSTNSIKKFSKLTDNLFKISQSVLGIIITIVFTYLINNSLIRNASVSANNQGTGSLANDLVSIAFIIPFILVLVASYLISYLFIKLIKRIIIKRRS